MKIRCGNRFCLALILAILGFSFELPAFAQATQITLFYKPAIYYKAYQPSAPDGTYQDVCIQDVAICKASAEASWNYANQSHGDSSTFEGVDEITPSSATWWGTVQSFGAQIDYIYNPTQQAATAGWDGYFEQLMCRGGDGRTDDGQPQPACYHTYPLAAPPCNCANNKQTTTPPQLTINVENGREVFRETDFEDPKGTLSVDRVYSSQTGLFLPSFIAGIAPDYPGTPSTQFAACVTVNTGNVYVPNIPTCLPYLPTPTGGTGAGIIDPDEEGRLELYTVSGTTVAKNSPDQTDTVTINGSGTSTTYVIHRPFKGWTDTYNYNGYHSKRAWPDGRFVTYSSLNGIFPNLMTDNFGRTLSLGEDASGRLSSITTPDNQSYSYTFGDATGLAPLDVPAVVNYPDGTSKHYFYHESSYDASSTLTNLTGIVDERGNRYLNVHYNESGFATSSDHAGVDEYQVTTGTSMTNPLGATLTYNFATNFNTIVASSTTQPGGSGYAGYAASTSTQGFDANGNPNSSTDFNGNQTHRTYDPVRNLETSRIEGYGSSSVRTITIAYHPYWALKSKLAEPKKLTFWIYNGQPDPFNSGSTASCAPSGALVDGQPIAVVCKRVEEATTDATGAAGFGASVAGTARTFTFTYDVNGQTLSATDPDLHVAHWVYYTSNDSNVPASYHTGDLKTYTDPSGRVTNFTQYDGAGRLMSKTDPNGVITAMTYWPRGWVKSKQVTSPAGGVEQTQFAYDPTGQLSVVTMPDATTITYSYDAAHRLVSVVDSANDTITYGLDAMGNRVSEQVTDPSGTLKRNIARGFDLLGRLQTVTGAQQ